MSKIADFLQNTFDGSGPSLPVVIGIVLAVAFVAMLFVTIGTVISIKRAESKKKTINLPKGSIKESNESGKSNERDKPVPGGEWLNNFLIGKGYIKVSSIVKSFFKALNFLSDSLGFNSKYKLPWYLVLGAENSGKSSLLSGFNAEKSFSEDDVNLSWWFLKSGVLLDVSGKVFLPEDSFDADEKSWQLILNLLSRYRANRPINGIVLTIPATELYGKSKLSFDEVKQRAMFISRKLTFAQNYIGLKLPIYIVITKTDIVPGFQSFCSEIPVRNRNNMLGWSNPYSIDSVYSSKLIDESFAFLEDELNEIRLEIFSESKTSSTRDGIFVFPNELLTVRENLSIYLDSLFKGASSDDRFYFRGFYFTGDSKMMPLLQFDGDHQESDMAIVGTPDANVNEAGQIGVDFNAEKSSLKKIFFFEDLLLKKVFLEEGLATPIRSKVYQANKSIFISQVSTVAFVVIGSFGLFSARDNLKKTQYNLYPTLYKISSLLRNVQDLTIDSLNSGGNELLSESTESLLSMMQQLNNIRFSSVFVPASWFSSINKNLTETLRVAYQRIVVRTIYMNLVLKARELLNLRPKDSDNSLDIAEVLNPYNSKEYALFNRYVTDLTELQKNITKFDSLRRSGDPKDLEDLIEYTFAGSLPSEFLENYEQYRAILVNTPFPSIDLAPYKGVAQETLKVLFQNYLDTIFTNRSEHSIISMLDGFLLKLSKQNIGKLPDVNWVRDFSSSLSSVCKELGEEGKTWIDNETFEVNAEYNKLLDKVELLFGKSVAQNLVDISAINFGYLKSKLIEFNSKLRGKGGVADPKEHITHGIYSLESSLRHLVSENFMAVPEKHELLTTIPAGKIIYWDDELITQAYETGKDFEQFFNVQIKEFPRVLQEGITVLARHNLWAVISGIIGKAQSVVDMPAGETDALTSEEILQAQIQELRSVAPKFISLLKILRGDSIGTVFGNLRAMLNRVGFSLLTHIDALLENQNPYMPANESFMNWNGSPGLGYTTYQVHDDEEMASYIKLQRKLVYRLALEFAEPVVTFLSSDVIFDQNYGSHSQLAKWSTIVNSVNGLKKKDPTNSISALERFIRGTMNQINLDNVTTLIPVESAKGQSSDYFTSILRKLKRGILSRAETLIRSRNIDRYEMLREFYKTHLEKSYPFTDIPKNEQVTNEADPDLVRAFFKMYDEFGGTPEHVLDQIYQLGDSANGVYKFMQNVHKFRKFFNDMFDGKYSIPKVTVEADFSKGKKNEKNTKYLVDRIFKPNDNRSIEFISDNRSAEWKFGDPVEFSLRWADGDDIPQYPRLNSEDNNMLLDGRTAIFRCNEKWAILRFLQKYKSGSTHSDEIQTGQTMLEFKVPLNDQTVSTCYYAVTLSIPKTSSQPDTQTLEIPAVLGTMPAMPDDIIAQKNESVLLEKQKPTEATITRPTAETKPTKKAPTEQKKPSEKKEQKSEPEKKDEEETIEEILEIDDLPEIEDDFEIDEEPMS